METFDLRVFGQRLRERRHDSDLSQQALADLMEAPQGWISELENARQTHVQADTVFRLCRALGVSADYLLGLVDTPTAEMPVTVRRQLGGWQGKVWVSPDFDETDEDLIRAFEGKTRSPDVSPRYARDAVGARRRAASHAAGAGDARCASHARLRERRQRLGAADQKRARQTHHARRPAGATPAARFDVLPITLAHALAAGALPPHHRDPFDRMLVAQAQLDGLTLVTHDARMRPYDVRGAVGVTRASPRLGAGAPAAHGGAAAADAACRRRVGALRDTLVSVVLVLLCAMVLLDTMVLRWGDEMGRWVRQRTDTGT